MVTQWLLSTGAESWSKNVQFSANAIQLYDNFIFVGSDRVRRLSRSNGAESGSQILTVSNLAVITLTALKDNLFIGYADGSVTWWNLTRSSKVDNWKDHQNKVMSLAASAQHLFSCSVDGIIVRRTFQPFLDGSTVVAAIQPTTTTRVDVLMTSARPSSTSTSVTSPSTVSGEIRVKSTKFAATTTLGAHTTLTMMLFIQSSTIVLTTSTTLSSATASTTLTNPSTSTTLSSATASTTLTNPSALELDSTALPALRTSKISPGTDSNLNRHLFNQF
jgi:hypothetical protein